MNVQISMKMHDEEIVDWLEDELGEDAAEKFTSCLIDPIQYTPNQMLEICNGVLKEVGSVLRLLSLHDQDDNGYVWRVIDETEI